jgi:hypothetical protein
MGCARELIAVAMVARGVESVMETCDVASGLMHARIVS